MTRTKDHELTPGQLGATLEAQACLSPVERILRGVSVQQPWFWGNFLGALQVPSQRPSIPTANPSAAFQSSSNVETQPDIVTISPSPAAATRIRFTRISSSLSVLRPDP